jgi:glycosyltransferase involved in cell wall biosynthesis
MNILWILDIDANYGRRHGGTLRYTQLSKGLLARGHRVYYVVKICKWEQRVTRNEYLEILRREGCFTEYIEIDECPVPSITRKLAKLAIHPSAQQRLLASYQVECKTHIFCLLKELAIDVSIVSDRACLFLLPQLSSLSTTIIDWCDSAVLFEMREIRLLAKLRKLIDLPSRVKELFYALSDEMYYGRRSAANIVVAPPDKKALDYLNGRSSVNWILQNGVEQSIGPAPAIAKDPNSLIFTGTMNFSPNYDGALWFIKNVMPLLIRKHRDIRLVIAGQEPISALLKCASENVKVTGFVPNLREEIQRSQLYVAPLLSGTGFRNKLVEAIASGTYVIGTPMALECLDDKLRRTLLIARAPEEFARRIEEYLNNPQAFSDRLCEAMSIVRKRYQWNEKVKELEEMCYQLSADKRYRWDAARHA